MAEMSKNGEGGISKKLNGLMKQLFPYFNESDQNDSTIHVEASNFNERWQVPDVAANTPPTTLGSNGESDRDRYFIKKMPSDRMAKYALLAEMAEDATIDAGINIHLGFALSVDSKTNKAITLKPKTEADTEYVAKLQAELVDPINEKIRNWLKPSCVFGTNYVRPYGEAGKGIIAWEASWDTLPINIKEYERAGQLAGFIGEKLVKKGIGGGIQLAEPWALIPLKLDNWTPDIHQPPIQNGVQQYSLYDDTHMRRPMETQNYGRSILESSLESWCAMRESLISLLSSRVLASKKDRFVHVSTAGLDTARAAEYVNLVADQLKADKEASLRKSARASAISTVWNAIIPSMGDKGGVTIDTQTMSPDIQHIEDIMFHIKRLCGSLGIDPSMVGFSDLLAGGLGEGGYLRTSIQSAMIANLLRDAARKFIYRAIDIHTAYRDGKVWLPEQRPFEVMFNSMSTAIALEEESARETRATYCTLVATVLDQIEQSPIGKSETLKSHLYSEIGFSSELIKKITAELAKHAAESESQMMESLGIPQGHDSERYIRDVILDVINDFGTARE